MAQLFSTGPVHVYVGRLIGGSTQASYLGTCEESPEVHHRPEYDGAKNTIGGVKKPFDMSYQGEDAMIGLDLTRWNEAVYAGLANRPMALSSIVGTRGTEFAFARGTLIQTEGVATVLWLLHSFGAAGAAFKTAMVGGGMPAGYRYPCTIPIDPEHLGPLGTKNRRLHLTFYAWGAWSVLTQAFTLYDHSMAGLPGIN